MSLILQDILERCEMNSIQKISIVVNSGLTVKGGMENHGWLAPSETIFSYLI